MDITKNIKKIYDCLFHCRLRTVCACLSVSAVCLLLCIFCSCFTVFVITCLCYYALGIVFLLSVFVAVCLLLCLLLCICYRVCFCYCVYCVSSLLCVCCVSLLLCLCHCVSLMSLFVVFSVYLVFSLQLFVIVYSHPFEFNVCLQLQFVRHCVC